MSAAVVETLLFPSKSHAFMLHEHWLLLLLMLHEAFHIPCCSTALSCQEKYHEHAYVVLVDNARGWYVMALFD